MIIAEIEGCDVHWTLVGTESSADILYLRAFNAMGIGRCKPLLPFMTVSSFSGDIYRPAGYATLRVTLEDGLKKETKQINFIIIEDVYKRQMYNSIEEKPKKSN